MQKLRLFWHNSPLRQFKKKIFSLAGEIFRRNQVVNCVCAVYSYTLFYCSYVSMLPDINHVRTSFACVWMLAILSDFGDFFYFKNQSMIRLWLGLDELSSMSLLSKISWHFLNFLHTTYGKYTKKRISLTAHAYNWLDPNLNQVQCADWWLIGWCKKTKKNVLTTLWRRVGGWGKDWMYDIWRPLPRLHRKYVCQMYDIHASGSIM